MTDTPPPILAEQALARLRKLADGNGVDPAKIELTGSDEQVYTLEGTLILTPKIETQSVRYPGPVRGKNRVILRSPAELHVEAKKRRDKFAQGRDWIEAAMKELKAALGEGWGLDGAEITLPEIKPVVLAAASACSTCQGRQLLTCPQCDGQGSVVCPHCQGRRQEPCTNCGGTGMNPSQPGQPCPICNGTRLTACRFCRASGVLTCPTCHGKRGTPCPTCNGTGQISEEILVAPAIESHFKLNGEGLPSGLRRGLSRLGISNLSKGHADIVMVQQPKNRDHEKDLKQIHDRESKGEAATHEVHYQARLPYADLRMNFNGKKALVSAFGKKGALLGVPPFLDDALEPQREKLREAAAGIAPIDDALKARLMRDALALELGSHGGINELRRSYAIGLSVETGREILRNMRLALNRYTLHLRRAASIVSLILSVAVFFGFFHTGLHKDMTQNWSPGVEIAVDAALLVAMMLLGSLALNASAYVALERRFPGLPISWRQKTGKTGYVLPALIFVIYAFVLISAPDKPAWLLLLAGHL